MDSTLSSIQDIQKSLEPYIKPRDQVSYIRRVLALHLESCLDSGGLQNPLSLVDSACTTTAGRDSRGLHREYLRALETNYKARRDHSSVKQQHVISDPPSANTSVSVTDPIDDHIGAIKLHEKQERLLVIQKYLDHLGREPAAALDFLDPDTIFQGSRRLPEIPKEVVQGFTVNTVSAKTDLKAVVSQLDKVVLRAKILLQSEERQLDEVRRRTSSVQSQKIGLGVKLQALNTARTELINWIEAELGKASPDGEGTDSEDKAQQSADGNGDTLGRTLGPAISNKLTDIKTKYDEYVKARGSLLDLSRHDPGDLLEPPVQLATESAQIKMEQATTTYLLTPYLENLLALSREQKVSISQKSHFSIALAKQMKETCHMLDRLAEESQLLPGHTAPGSSRSKFRLSDDLGLGASEKPDSSGRVKTWVSAADAAKMATLEAVAEKLEEGQVALEGSMGALHEVERLLGQNSADQAEASSEEEEDVWLAEARPSKKPTHSRKPAGGKGRKTEKESEVWSVLQGNLGFTHHGASA